MKLALDVSSVPERVAGAGRYIVELARRLPETGLDTTLVTRVDDSARWLDVAPHAHVVSLVPKNRPARLFHEAWRLGTSSTAQDVDVWHSPHYSMAHRGSTPTVVTIHDLTFFTNPEWHEKSKVVFFRRAIEYSSTHAKVLVCVSEFTARQLDEFVPHHVPVIVAPLGVDLTRFSVDGTDDTAAMAHYSLPSHAPFVLFVGTVEPRKGLDVLLEAFVEVADANSDIELWIAGQDGWSMRGFSDDLRRHPAAARIRRLGFVDDRLLPVLMRRARVVAYPSRGEGFGLPVLEALACGAMVVTSSDTVMAEVAGDAAQLVRAGDPVALAHAIVVGLDVSDVQRLERSRLARARADSYAWTRTLEQHLVAYELAKGA